MTSKKSVFFKTDFMYLIVKISSFKILFLNSLNPLNLKQYSEFSFSRKILHSKLIFSFSKKISFRTLTDSEEIFNSSGNFNKVEGAN